MMSLWFFKGSDNLYGKIIRFLTNSPYSHCLLQFSDGSSFSSSHADGGSCFQDKENTEKLIADIEAWDSISLPWISPAQEKRIYLFCRQEDSCEYDYFGVLFGWLNSRYQNPDKWFCSEICLSVILPFTKGIRDQWYSPGALYNAVRDALVWNKK